MDFTGFHAKGGTRVVHLEGVLTWAFEFENQPLLAGYRTLSTQGIAKPVLNTFRMFSMLEPVRSIPVADREAQIRMELPRHAVSLVRLEY